MIGVLVLLGAGWLAGLVGVTAAVTEWLLARRGRRPSQPLRVRRWTLLWLVLTPACELRCEDPLERRPRGETPRPTHHALWYERTGLV